MSICSSTYNSEVKYDFSNLKRETCFIIDSNGNIQYIEASISKVLGYSDLELLQRKYNDFLYDVSYANELSYLPYCNKVIELMLRHKDSHCVYVQAALEHVYNTDMDSFNIYGSMTEIIKPRHSEAELDLTRKIVDNSKDVLYRYSVSNRRFKYLSKSVFQLLGYMPEQIIADSLIINNNIHPDDSRKFRRSYIKSSDCYSDPIAFRIRHRDGHYIYIEDCPTPIFADDGTLIYIDGACRDITQKFEFEKHLKYLTFHDALSGLYNRNYFEEEFNKLNNQIDVPVAIILCDLDNLKIVNDSLGHDNGDQMIMHVGKLLSSLTDKNSLVARIGGDEFVIIQKESSLFNFKKLVDALTSEIDEYNKSLVNFSINMSIGSAYNDHSLNNMQRIFKLADNQMYLNKSIRKAL